jgi:hypothetical protein
LPPSPAVSFASRVHVVPSAEISMRYAVAYAASHASSTLETVALRPRSTRIHCGSLPSALAQRVEASPSNALAGARVESSFEEAVADLPREMS